METQANPFRIDGVVTPPHFTNRAEEITRIRQALRSPPAKLLCYGPRRVGKTSTILVASQAVERFALPASGTVSNTAQALVANTSRCPSRRSGRPYAEGTRSVEGRNGLTSKSTFLPRIWRSATICPTDFP